MIYIANPIYDVVFKYLMEDERAARLLISRLLKKEVVALKTRRNEYCNTTGKDLTMFRIDFAATVRDDDGQEHLVIIELQKTWKPTETLRFRQYLAVQYESKENILPGDERYGLPIVSIYILGHRVGNLEEPVVYVRRQYLDYDDNVITKGVPEKFVESLTHDSIIVQVPLLSRSARNHVETLLSIFDQSCEKTSNGHVLVYDDEGVTDAGLQYLISRLTRAGMDPDVRQTMNVEDEFLTELEERETLIKRQNAQLEQKDAQLEQKDAQLEQQNAQLEQQQRVIRGAVCGLHAQGLPVQQIAAMLQLKEGEVRTILQNSILEQ